MRTFHFKKIVSHSMTVTNTQDVNPALILQPHASGVSMTISVRILMLCVILVTLRLAFYTKVFVTNHLQLTLIGYQKETNI